MSDVVIVVSGEAGTEGFEVANALVQIEYWKARVQVSETSLLPTVIPNKERPSSTGSDVRAVGGSVGVVIRGGVPKMFCEDGNANDIKGCVGIIDTTGDKVLMMAIEVVSEPEFHRPSVASFDLWSVRS